MNCRVFFDFIYSDSIKNYPINTKGKLLPLGGLGVVLRWTDREIRTKEQRDIAEKEQLNSLKNPFDKTFISFANRAFEITNLRFTYNFCTSFYKCDISFYY